MEIFKEMGSLGSWKVGRRMREITLEKEKVKEEGQKVERTSGKGEMEGEIIFEGGAGADGREGREGRVETGGGGGGGVGMQEVRKR